MRKLLVPATALTTALLLGGCGSASSGHNAALPPAADLSRVSLAAAQLDELAAADRAFGNDLFVKLSAANDGNVVFSPASVATALQMAFAGAKGQTAAEMAATMHLGSTTPITVAAAASRLLQSLAPLAHDKASLLAIANDVWVQSGFALEPTYDAEMRSGFGSSFNRTDFQHQPEQSRQAINARIAAETRDKILNLLQDGAVNDATRLVLTNAIYMKARWLSPFDKSGTEPQAFTTATGTRVQAPTMSMTEGLSYAHGDGYQAVRLPYEGDRLAMTLILPDPGKPLMFPSAQPTFRDRPVDLQLPKFRFTWHDGLNNSLQDLGMKQAFTDSADFSGITNPSSLQIALVQHQAFIDVNENGTEAAASTAVVMVGTAGIAPKSLVQVHFDRPFLFSIDDLKTGLPLFVGKVADPTLSE